MKKLLSIHLFCIAFFPVCLLAQPTLRVNIGEIIAIEARQAPLAQVLDEIAEKAAIKMHYSVPADTLVTAICAGENLKQAMDCLLGSKANLVFRYNQSRKANTLTPPLPSGRGEGTLLPSELWILSSNFEAAPASSQCTATPPKTVSNAAHTAHKEIVKLLEMAASDDASQRASALSRLSLAGREDDFIVKQALKNALSDKEASVRAQAVFGMARREGEQATYILENALHDQDASVRIMAVDAAGSDFFAINLLKQALTDSDKGVSDLAALKLQAISASNL